MVGPFKTAPGGLTHLLVAVGKFTKWIEAKPIKKLDGSSTIKFFNEIITRYGVPHSIITDNGTNFAKGVFADYYGKKGIRLDLVSVAHPQTNGQVEKANGLILAGIKPRLVEPLECSAGCCVTSRNFDFKFRTCTHEIMAFLLCICISIHYLMCKNSKF
jgi:hypothetical protein